MYRFIVFLLGGLSFGGINCLAFEGQIRAAGGRSGSVAGLLYTVDTGFLRVEMTDTNFPNAIDIVDLGSGQVTLIQPMNATFVRFQPGTHNASGFPGLPGGLPPGIGPQAQPGVSAGAPPPPPQLPPGIGPTNFPGLPARPGLPAGLPPGVGPQAQPPAMPAMPARPPNPGAGARPAMPMMMPPGGGLELQATGESTNLLKYHCQRYQIQQREQTMEIWATDQLVPFQVYLPNQPPGFGPPMIEQQWAALLSARKLFPLSAVLRAENGVELYRFEVQSIALRKLAEGEKHGFEPPAGYVEIPARPM